LQVVVALANNDDLPAGNRPWTDEDYRRRDEVLAKMGIKIGRKK